MKFFFISICFFLTPLFAEVFYDAEGFEKDRFDRTSLEGPWLQYGPYDTQQYPDRVRVIEKEGVKRSHALAIADKGERNIARLVLNLKEKDTVWDAWIRTEAENDPGAVLVTLRFSDSAKVFLLDVIDGDPTWMDDDNKELRVETEYGEWQRVTIQVDMKAKAYRFFLNGRKAFEGEIEAEERLIRGWEVDARPHDDKRKPQGDYVVYVDDVRVTEKLPLDVR